MGRPPAIRRFRWRASSRTTNRVPGAARGTLLASRPPGGDHRSRRRRGTLIGSRSDGRCRKPRRPAPPGPHVRARGSRDPAWGHSPSHTRRTAHVSKNVAVFVDVANLYYAARGQDVDVDYVALLKHATKGRDLIRAYAYSGLDPENENQKKFLDFLGKNGYRVVAKDIRKFGDGRVKANLDIELVVDLFRLAERMDVAVIVSGDGDFAPAIRALQDVGVRCEVISFRPNTSSDLFAVADEFHDVMKISAIGRQKDAKGVGAPEMPAKEVNPDVGFREASPTVAAAALAAIRSDGDEPAGRGRGRSTGRRSGSHGSSSPRTDTNGGRRAGGRGRRRDRDPRQIAFRRGGRRWSNRSPSSTPRWTRPRPTRPAWRHRRDGRSGRSRRANRDPVGRGRQPRGAGRRRRSCDGKPGARHGVRGSRCGDPGRARPERRTLGVPMLRVPMRPSRRNRRRSREAARGRPPRPLRGPARRARLRRADRRPRGPQPSLRRRRRPSPGLSLTPLRIRIRRRSPEHGRRASPSPLADEAAAADAVASGDQGIWQRFTSGRPSGKKTTPPTEA